MPLRKGYGVGKPEIGVAVGIGVSVAAVAGLAAGAALRTGVLTVGAVSNARRGIKPALEPEDVKWDAQGRIVNWSHVLKIVQQGGVSPTMRAHMWPFLLGVHSPTSTAVERSGELTRLRSLYTKLVLICQELEHQIASAKRAQEARAHNATQKFSAAGASLPKSGPPSPEKALLPGNLAAFAEAHRIIVMDAVRTDMRVQPSDATAVPATALQAGSPDGEFYLPLVSTMQVLPVSVSDGLPELMLQDPPDLDPVEAVAHGRLPVWRSELATSVIGTARHVAPAGRRLMMRLVNILSAYAVHDPENGYCQGMSDLAAAFVQIIEDDALAFGCFERLMRDARQNFRHDESGIKTQLARVARILADIDPVLYAKLEELGVADCMFAYRMVIVMLRRELALGEALILWEVKWALEASLPDTLGRVASDELTSPSTSASLDGTGISRQTTSALASTVASIEAATKASVAELNGNKDRDGLRRVVKTTGAAPMKAHGSSTSPGAPNFILQFVAATVRAQRGRIIGECCEGDDVLRLFNSVKISFWSTLAQARKQHKAYSSPLLAYIQ